MELIWFLIIGIVAGFSAGKLIRGGGFGLLANLLVGAIGAILGGWLFGELGISGGGAGSGQWWSEKVGKWETGRL